jgi:cytochrome b
MPGQRCPGIVISGWSRDGASRALVVRVAWGFVVNRCARFADFVLRPAALVTYLKALAQGQEPRFIGHNRAGAVMMPARLTLDANSILVFAGAQVAAALFESWRHDENLVGPMITGRKRA